MFTSHLVSPFLLSHKYSSLCIRLCHAVCLICFQQFCKLFQSACTNRNVRVHSVFLSTSFSCRDFVGYNVKYGKEAVRDYSNVCPNSVSIVKEFTAREGGWCVKDQD